MSNNNFIIVSYITSSGREGNDASEFSFVGNITNQDGASIDAADVSLIETLEKSRDGDEIESILSLIHIDAADD